MLVVVVAGVLPNMDVVAGPNCEALVVSVPNREVALTIVPNCGALVVGAPNCGALVVGAPNCGAVVAGVPNCDVAVVVAAPNAATVLLLIAPKTVVPLAIVVSVGVALVTLVVPNTNRGLVTDEIEGADVPKVNVGAPDSPNAGVAVVVIVVVAFMLNELLVVVIAELFDVKLKDLLVFNGNDVAWLFATFPKAFVDCMLPPDWPNPNMLDDFGDCKAVLPPPKVNNDVCAGTDDAAIVAMLFNTLLAMLVKPVILVTFMLVDNDFVPVN